jgi:hypothetical protein
VKKNIIALFGLLLISIVLAIIVRNTMFKKDSISNYMTLDEVQSKNLTVANYNYKEEFEEEYLDDFAEEVYNNALECENAFIVSPTGNLYVNNEVIMQEAIVEQIIKGQCKYEKIWICSEGSSIERSSDDAYTYKGITYSLMQLENKYLVFCDPSEINDYSDKKIYYINDSLWFSYYNITKDSDKVMDGRKYDENIEFYTDSEPALKCFNEMKHKIFKGLHIE